MSTPIDQLPKITVVTRDLDNSGGYRMKVDAQNTSPTESPDL